MITHTAMHDGHLAELDLAICEGDQGGIASTSSGVVSSTLDLANLFAALTSLAETGNDVVLTTGKGISRSAGATPVSSPRTQDAYFGRRHLTSDLRDVDVDMGQL